MGLEKRLLFIATLLLICEVLWLAADMNIIYISGITKESAVNSRELIGQVEERQFSLKRRYQNSIVWEDTKKDEPLYLFDSVLTLDRSSATLKLHGNTQLKLSENTLVFLEPSSKSGVDQLKIRFSRGDVRSRNPDRDVAVESDTWTVEINKGSEVNLRTKNSKSLEVEVLQGQVKVHGEEKNGVKKSSQEFGTGDVIRMENDTVEHQKLTDAIRWRTPIENLLLLRKYSHTFPATVNLEWQGSTRELSWEDPNGNIENIAIPPGATSHSLALEKGTHHFRLRTEKGTTPILPVEVWQAPVIQTYWPLPRDRFVSGQTVMFSWGLVEDIAEYTLVLRNPSSLANDFQKNQKRNNLVNETIALVGPYDWGVEGQDSLGFQIPSFYFTPVYFLVDPLAPPILRPPEIRRPASQKPPATSGLQKQFLQFIKEIFLSTANAETPEDYQAVFRWEPVKGAAGYVIEIDDESDFKSPLAVDRVKSPEFVWSRFVLGKYFWRVAAEGSAGQMGLFSPVTPVDLTDPKVFDPKPFVKPAPKPVAKKIKEIDLNSIEPEIPKNRQTLLPSQVRMYEEEKAERVRPVRGHFRLNPTFEQTTVEDTGFKSQFRGYYLMSAQAQIDVPWNEVEELSFKFSYRQAQFRPQPTDDFPFQERLNRSQMAASALYGQSQKFQVGLRTSTVQPMTRTGFEAVRFDSKLVYGLVVSFPMTERPWLSQMDIWTLSGSQLWVLGFESVLGYEAKLSRRLTLQYGLALESQFLKASDQREIAIHPKVFLGISW
jgi:hypothetical protein